MANTWARRFSACWLSSYTMKESWTLTSYTTRKGSEQITSIPYTRTHTKSAVSPWVFPGLIRQAERSLEQCKPRVLLVSIVAPSWTSLRRNLQRLATTRSSGRLLTTCTTLQRVSRWYISCLGLISWRCLILFSAEIPYAAAGANPGRCRCMPGLASEES